MKINFQATNLNLGPEILDYCREKLSHLEKLVAGDENAFIDVEIGKTTRHHKQGEIFRTEMSLHLNGKRFRSEEITEDFYASIDKAKDELSSKIKRYQKRQSTLVRRGGRLVKNFLRGVYNYKWRKH